MLRNPVRPLAPEMPQMCPQLNFHVENIEAICFTFEFVYAKLYYDT